MFASTKITARLASRSTATKVMATRSFTASTPKHMKVVCALYEGGEAGKHNPDIYGCVENELGLRQFLEARGHEYLVTSDKDGDHSEFAKNLHDADVVISQPFWPAYITRERIAKAPKLKLAITAGIGSDHVDLAAACDRNITVAEVTGSNVVSVAEHVVMMILSLVRNYMPAYKQVVDGDWDIAAIANHAYDLEDKHVGTVAAGRIGLRVMRRLKPFDVKLHYTDKVRLPADVEKELNVKWHPTVEDMVKECDVVTINCPLHPETENLFDVKMLSKMKKGAHLVNTARGKIVDRDALVKAVESGHIQGYAGDVWFPQPAPADHPWRSMPRHAMTPHYSGTTLDAQARYAAGTKEILERFFDGKPQRPEYLIAEGGKVTSASYTHGDATSGST
ncbi:Formate dehydrogenase [Phytophthora fragariae]|uniref:Formate dehydrogenase n=1 Tax=Phytophthora fragariae TaxID=53985 RepID=A0A6A3RJ47_9STRA|nr:Formate dehydrogenase [Phytophthora fragariae]KAE8932080.1 Formate dehydrogenase [Phytophthora fragariae]KAE9096801.1 Formate dehydrogenase [Phytophthora fragariae]KAE9097156.1 Formate dehydrogenase [Phytophthora fragariae]KAE9131136.1 Formate dehydrogenase [Phytophthora fragariae]